MNNSNEQKALAAYIAAFDIDPNRREPLMKMAEYYWRKGSPDHVIPLVAAALQIKGDGGFYANFQPYYEQVPHELMYWALWQKGEYNESKRHFDICFAYQPFNPKYLHDYRFYYKLPKISFVIPTLGRPEGLMRCIDSIKAIDYPQEQIEIIVLHDGEPDDKTRFVGCNEFYSKERNGVPVTVALGLKAATGDWIVYASNDIEFAPDSIMCAYKTALDNQKLFMAFNTGDVLPDEGNICEHFMIHKNLIKKLGGEIFDTEFNHVGVDNLLWAKVKKLGHGMRCKRALVKHNHFSRGGEMDEVYRIAWNEENVAKDRELLAKKLLELNKQPE